MALFTSASDTVIQTEVPAGTTPRTHYLHSYQSSPAPVISHSSFVSRAMVEHLMQNKKDSALGVKFEPDQRDAITNMEGAMHTFLTPFAPMFMHGDYRYFYGHSIVPFSTQGGRQGARIVVLSALVQPDFEDGQVMIELARLGLQPFQGQRLSKSFVPIGVQEKQRKRLRISYDITLKRHLVAHLTSARLLPAISAVTPLSIPEAELQLVEAIKHNSAPSFVTGQYIRCQSGEVLSLEILFKTAYEQARNEFRALERLCTNGYIYTFDPPAIFARRIGALLLNRLQFAALQLLAEQTSFSHMRVYAFNDYADAQALELIRLALRSHPNITLLSKAALFNPDDVYSPPTFCQGAILVVHNNSDGFGQNIETEHAGGSMDGALGVYSSAAASLHRQHPHLLDHLMTN